MRGIDDDAGDDIDQTARTRTVRIAFGVIGVNAFWICVAFLVLAITMVQISLKMRGPNPSGWTPSGCAVLSQLSAAQNVSSGYRSA